MLHFVEKMLNYWQLLNWIDFFAISTMFHPCNGGIDKKELKIKNWKWIKTEKLDFFLQNAIKFFIMYQNFKLKRTLVRNVSLVWRLCQFVTAYWELFFNNLINADIIKQIIYFYIQAKDMRMVIRFWLKWRTNSINRE